MGIEAMSKMWSRMARLAAPGAKGSLQAELQTVTHTGAADVSEDSFAPIISASHNAEDRLVIMKHLHDCLSDSSCKHWKRIYGGLVLLEMLLTSGSCELLAEIAGGLHFDLAQRLLCLEHFRCDNKRVQTMVKLKTEKLHKDALPSLESRVDKMTGKSQDSSTNLHAFFVRRPSSNHHSPGVAFRNSKDFDDKCHGDEIAFYDSFVSGTDEGDGWLRVGQVFLPFNLPSGECVLFSMKSPMPKDESSTDRDYDPQFRIDEMLAGMESDIAGILDMQDQSEMEKRNDLAKEKHRRCIQEFKKSMQVLHDQALPISYESGQKPEVLGKSM